MCVWLFFWIESRSVQILEMTTRQLFSNASCRRPLCFDEVQGGVIMPFGAVIADCGGGGNGTAEMKNASASMPNR